MGQGNGEEQELCSLTGPDCSSRVFVLQCGPWKAEVQVCSALFRRYGF
jgi:hypothetical protein